MVADLIPNYASEHKNQDIAEVSCVPDPDPEPDSKRVFQRSGNWLPTCPGGVRQLSTIFVGEGEDTGIAD